MRERQYPALVGWIRLCGLFLMLLATWIDGAARPLRKDAARAQWAKKWCRRLLRYLRCRVEVRGVIPSHGFIASNHISYVDVLVLSALTPAIFVAKKEVRSWPLIGALCARNRAVFLDRESLRAAATANRAIADDLRNGNPVVVFPEGTTSDGNTILPLHAALFQAPLESGAPILPAWISYTDDFERERVAYWGDMTLVPHLVQLLRLRSIHVCVQFRTTGIPVRNRTQAAQMCRVVWEQMRNSASGRRQESTAA